MKKFILLFAILFSAYSNFYATHLKSAEITYIHVSGNDYEVTLKIYSDCAGIALGANQTINLRSLSCAQNFNYTIPFISSSTFSQGCPSQITTCNGGTFPGLRENIFRGNVTLTTCTDWIMSWNSCCRNPTISNLVNPGSNSLYIQNTLNNLIGVNNNSPQFFGSPSPYFNVNDTSTYNHGATDVDGDSLYFSLATPLKANSFPISGIPISFAMGYSQNQPIMTSYGFNLNHQTGEMCFTPNSSQNAVVSTLIEEFRNGILIGSQIREISILTNSTTNQNPTTAIATSCSNSGGMTITVQGASVTQIDGNSISMCPNDSICFEIDVTDPNGDNVELLSNIAAVMPGASFNIANNNTTNPVATVCWVPSSSDAGLHILAVTATDNACPLTGVQTFTFDINVSDGVYAGADQTICGIQNAQLGSSSLPASSTWYDASTNIIMPVGPDFSCNPCSNPVAKPAVTTNYYVASSSAACVSNDTVLITIASDFTANVMGDAILCDTNTTQQLDVNILTGPTGTYSFIWNNSSTLSNAFIQNPVASPTQSTWYTPAITSPQGCTKIVDSTFVQVSSSYYNNVNVSICSGDSILIYGQSHNSAGIYYDSLQTVSGCDSVLSTTLSLSSLLTHYTFTDNGGGSYSFSNTSTGNYTQSFWNFGDGTTSSATNPNHTYLVDGIYTVVLAVTDSSTSSSSSCLGYYVDTITVAGAVNSLQCNAGFSVYLDTIASTVVVANSSTGSNLTYFWDFGDGTTSTLQNPNHTYASSGPFYLCLTVNDGSGCSDMFCDSVGINGIVFKGAAGFTINVVPTNITTSISSNTIINNFSIYPNPSSGKFTIEKAVDLNQNVQIKIFDVNSKLILENTILVNQQKIDVNISKYSKGIYYLKFIVDSKIAVRKIIKD